MTKYISIFIVLFSYFSNTYDEFVTKIEQHLNSTNFNESDKNKNLKNMINDVRKYDENIEILENDVLELRVIILEYLAKYKKTNVMLSDCVSNMFYISRCIMYSVPTEKGSYIKDLIILKSILKYFQKECKIILEKIKFLKTLRIKILNKIRDIKKNYDLLSKKIYKFNLNSNKKLIDDKLSRVKNISKNIFNITDLINELDVEEYIGDLKKVSGFDTFKNKLDFVCPCKYVKKNFTDEAILFYVKPISKIFAPEDGIVIFNGKLQNKNILIIKHNKTLKSVISGDIVNCVNVGDKVIKNQKIAEMNDSVHDISCLELKILKDGKFDDHNKYLKI